MKPSRYTKPHVNDAQKVHSRRARTAQPKQPQRARVALVVALVVLALLAAGGLWAWTHAPTEVQHGLRDPNAQLGQYAGKSDADVRAELDRMVEEGMFDISIASVVHVADGTSQGELRIENVPGNRYLMGVSIVRDDTGEEVYRSGLIEPGMHIQYAPLAVDLDAGSYSCTAVFTAYDKETEQPVGEAAAKMMIVVEG